MALFKLNDKVIHKSTENTRSFNKTIMLVIGVGYMSQESGEDVIYLVSYLSIEHDTRRNYLLESELVLYTELNY